jgi:hypothetical protein
MSARLAAQGAAIVRLALHPAGGMVRATKTGNFMRRLLSAAASGLIIAAAAHAAPPPSQGLDAIVQDYFDKENAAHPVNATSLGVHLGDAVLDDESPAAHHGEAHRLHETYDALYSLDASTLTPNQRDDRDILGAQIQGQLLEEEQIQQWRHNPDTYVSLATSGPYTLITRDFAPAVKRMQSVMARERSFPALFASARANLINMPPVFVEIALEDVDGAIDFLSKDVPAAFAGAGTQVAQADLKQSTAIAVKACQDFKTWLQAQQKNAHGSFVLGPDRFRVLLASDMIDLPADRILQAGQAQLKKDRDAFLATSRLVDPKTPDHALADIEADHPDAAHLVSTARDQLAMLRQFIVGHHIIDLPSNTLPKVAETPQFQRALVFGEMDFPGPFEKIATQSYYYITPPDTAKPAKEQDQYLSYFNRSLLLNLSVHEALPGHFVQYLYQQANPNWSLVRKLGHSYTATEGWAHYTEQMMPDEGLLNGDPKLRLAQLQDALLRDCRLIGSIEMHTKGLSLADAAKMMADQCLQPPPVAYKEARRGTSDPGYFSYTLGKLMILKLRGDVQAAQGKSFDLAKFHDAFLNSGLVPIAVIRREITGKDGEAL